MAATIDKGSITAMGTADPKVFRIGFDFTDDATVVATQGWLNTWKHAEFTYNTNMTTAQFNTAANTAMQNARKPAAETTLETTLKSMFGTTIVRTNPDIPVVYQKVQIAAISDGVIFDTNEVV